MMIGMLAFWALVILGVVLVVQRLRGDGGSDDARAALDGRLARGEITTAEYRQLDDEISRRRSRDRWPAAPFIVAGGILLMALVVAPMVAMASWGWGMWDTGWGMRDMGWGMRDMHGRGANTAGSPLVQSQGDASVAMRDFAFEPGNLAVPVGATVTWTNEDPAVHDATARDADWRTERLSEGRSDSVSFDTAGAYDYYCSIHPSMEARVVVQ